MKNFILIDLQPLHTEGDGLSKYPAVSNYRLLQANVPAGISSGTMYLRELQFVLRICNAFFLPIILKMSAKKNFINSAAFDKNLSPVLAADANALFNRSSQPSVFSGRGNPDNNDNYMSFSLKVGLILGREYKL